MYGTMQPQQPTYIISGAQQQPGTNTVVIRDTDNRSGPGYGGMALGMAAGAVTGAALYSMGTSVFIL